jgi:hypothetical protein
MAGFAEMASIARSSLFQSRVEYCLKKAAIAVMAEDAATGNHAERVAYAKKVIDGTASVGEVSLAVVTNSTLTGNGNSSAADMGVSDGDLEFTVNSMFNAFAGVATA